MAMSAADMAAAIRIHQTTITPSPSEGPISDSSYADDMLVAMCQGIIDEIINGAVIGEDPAGTGPHVHPNINVIS
jgi:hypothetical protein